ncbi:MAG: hypothetical protein CM15mP62_19770 [Rhodospirillaceae bacterium]|nr:MAG: hypothetical protein CM15mP62_19770 [Rhodospirillaceae bacterium]
MPIRRRLLGDLAGDKVSAAMGLDSATGNATRMMGPLLGGIMLQLVGMFGVFWLSGFLYAICLLLIIVSSFPRGLSRQFQLPFTATYQAASSLRPMTLYFDGSSLLPSSSIYGDFHSRR